MKFPSNFLSKMNKQTMVGLVIITVFLFIVLFMMYKNRTTEGLETDNKLKNNILDGINVIDATKLKNIIKEEEDEDNKTLFQAIKDYKDLNKELKNTNKDTKPTLKGNSSTESKSATTKS